MLDNAAPVTLTRRAVREAERATQRAVADPVILDVPTVPAPGAAVQSFEPAPGAAMGVVPVAQVGQTSYPTRAELRRAAAKVDADQRAVVVVADVPVPAALQVEMVAPEGMSTVPAARARWVPRVAVLSALGAVTIVVPLAGSQPVVSASAQSVGSTTATTGSGASARAMALVASSPSVVDTLAGGGTPIEAAAALTADPTAASRAVTDASRAYLREALECPVQSGANGALSAVMGGEELERLSMPVAEGRYRITSGYGYRTYPFPGMHEGTDFAGSLGTPLHAVADGVVTYAGGPRDGRSGNIIVITSEVDGQTVDFWYGHMYVDGLFVRVGQEVTAGQVIGEIGNAGRSTGPHLHFEVHPEGRTTDPQTWLRTNGAEPVGAAAACQA